MKTFSLSILVTFLYTFSAFSQSLGGTVQLFRNEKFYGANIKLNITENGKCQTLNVFWRKEASSFKISYTDICVDMYSEKNCEGEKRIRISPERIEMDKFDFRQWNFENSLVSLQACENTEQKENTIALMYFDGNKEKVLYQNIFEFECKNILKEFVGAITKAKVFRTCFRYYPQTDCKGDYIESVYGELNKLKKRRVPKNTMSISGCEYNEKSPVIATTSAQFSPKISNTSSNVRPTPKTLPEIPPSVITASLDYNSDKPRRRIDDDQKEENKSMGKELIVIVVVSIIATTLFIMIMYGFYKYTTAKKAYYERVVELEFQNEKFVQEFIKGNPKAFDLISYEKADAIFRAQNAPYDSEAFEIPLSCLKMDNSKPLGSGECGLVLKAKLQSPKFPTSFHVAVKTVKTGSDSGYVRALLDECKIMMYLNSTTKHTHIVNLIGACTENLSKLEPYIIIEYCSIGSLHKFLRKKRKTFENLVQNGQLIYPRTANEEIEDNKVINTFHLMKWSRDIADGMDYLALKKVIHGDLAARNILLDENYNVKISDFGLSRQLYQYSLYVKKTQIPLPWRWMAIESLRDMTFSSQSDVWAFGVTLWEIFSLAETPYPGIPWNTLFTKSLRDGFRMSQPIFSPFNVYEWMLSCWKESPKERPNFLELKSLFSSALPFQNQKR